MAHFPSFDPAPADEAVVLRRWRVGDVPQIVAACGDPDTQRWTTVPAGYGDDDAREFVRASEQRWAGGESADVAVVDAADDARLLGSIALMLFDAAREQCEIGYWIAPDARRRGVAVRAVRLLSTWGFAQLPPLRRIELIPFAGNDASARVAQRAGYRREREIASPRGPSKEGVEHSVLFSLTAA